MTEQFDLQRTLEISCAVYRNHGFVKSGHSYFDGESGNCIQDSKSIVRDTYLEITTGKKVEDSVTVEVTAEDVEHAKHLTKYFRSKLVVAKLADKLSDWDKSIAKVFEHDKINHRDLSMVTCLPNSYVVDQHRKYVQSVFKENLHVGSYFGTLKSRIKFQTTVIDVKHIQRDNYYIVTSVTDENQIVKFFIKHIDDIDLSATIKSRRITIIGTVSRQDRGKYSNCYETVVNRVKVIDG